MAKSGAGPVLTVFGPDVGLGALIGTSMGVPIGFSPADSTCPFPGRTAPAAVAAPVEPSFFPRPFLLLMVAYSR
jgi:hypothetical protein